MATFVGLAQRDWSLALRRGLPIALFVIGIAIAAVVLEIGGRHRVRHLHDVDEQRSTSRGDAAKAR